jgi:hypothetical protein
MYDEMKFSWGEHFSCIGIGFSKIDSDILFNGFPDGVQLSSNDSPKFDMTRSSLEEELDNEFSYAIYGNRVHLKVAKVMERHSKCSLKSLLINPDGMIIEQTCPGAMKSGRNVTSIGNTVTRSRRAEAVDIYIREHFSPEHVSATRAAGDDCVETHHIEKERVYALFGFLLRDYVVLPPGEIEFCSHIWRRGSRPVGQRIGKSLARLICGDRTDDQVSAFITAYSNHPDSRVATSIALASRGRANT